MGNRIADIGKMKSRVDGEKRLRNVDLKKTAKLGTEKNPAVVHVRTEERLKEVTALFKEKGLAMQDCTGTGQAGGYRRSGTSIESTPTAESRKETRT